jgi:DNA-binding IclR family transcriptional regulator
MRLGAAVIERLDERRLALPAMERMRERLGETVFLFVRRGEDAVCIERLEGVRVQSPALRVGDTLPLHAGAGPRALLAWEPREEWEAYVRGRRLEAFTERTPATRTSLFRELEQTVADGYAVGDEDVTPGIATLAMPIFDYTNRVRAALAVGGIKSLVLGDDREEILLLLGVGAREISTALGHEG